MNREKQVGSKRRFEGTRRFAREFATEIAIVTIGSIALAAITNEIQYHTWNPFYASPIISR